MKTRTTTQYNVHDMPWTLWCSLPFAVVEGPHHVWKTYFDLAFFLSPKDHHLHHADEAVKLDRAEDDPDREPDSQAMAEARMEARDERGRERAEWQCEYKDSPR